MTIKQPAIQPSVKRCISPISGAELPVEKRFRPGESGNPKGRSKNGAATVREWLTVMSEWEEARIASVARGSRTPAAQKMAAKRILGALRDTQDGGGPEFDRVMDRTVGRPSQAVELTGANGGPLAIEDATPIRVKLALLIQRKAAEIAAQTADVAPLKELAQG